MRHVYASPQNEIRFGRGRGAELIFKPLLTNIFRRTIYNPSLALLHTFSIDNYCILASIILTCHLRFRSMSWFALRSKKGKLITEELIKTLNFNGLFSMTKKGLAIAQLAALEKQNSPIPAKLLDHFPYLQAFQGFALNIYKIRQENKSFYLAPLSISQHSRCSNFMQIDMLHVTNDIMAPSHSAPANHVIFIPHMAGLMAKFRHKTNRNHFNIICRSCARVFWSKEARESHYITCSIDARTAQVKARKRSQNTLVHRPMRLNKWTNIQETNGLKWERKTNFILLKPLAIVFG